MNMMVNYNILIVAVLVSLLISWLSWKRKPADGSITLALLMLCIAQWTFAEVLYGMSAGFAAKLFWFYLKYLGIVLVPVAWLILALKYTKRDKFITKLNMALLLVIPFITLLLIFTNGFHGLVFKDIQVINNGYASVLLSTNGIWFWVHTAYSYTLILFGTLLLLDAFFNFPAIYRKQTGIILIGAFIPWIGNILYVFNLIPLSNVDITPLTMLITGLLFFWALFRYKLLDLVPVARYTIIEDMSDLILVLDNQKRIVDANPAAIKAVNRKASSVIGQTVSQALSPWPRIVERFRNVEETKEKLVLDDGISKRYYDLKISQINDRKGNPTGSLVVMRDITELEEAINELKTSREAAEAASKAKSRFLAAMSHEIRRPMNAVIGMSDLLAETKMTRKQMEYIEMIKGSADLLLTIINDILDFSQIEAGKFELEKTSFNIRDTINIAVKIFAIQERAKNPELTCSIGEGVPEVLIGDSARLKQVLINLIGNAVKFTPAGSVDVRADVVDSENNYVKLEFSVSDTGIGIPEEKMDKLFQSFYPADNTSAVKYGGTGLGLAIAKILIEAMGGFIKVESEVGKGSRFSFEISFEIPIDTAPGAPVKEKCNASNTAVYNGDKDVICVTGKDAACKGEKDTACTSRKVSILLAEDNTSNQILMTAMLVKQGWNIDIAGNGKKVLEKLKSNDYDVILMDIQMPEVDGFETAALIRGSESDTGRHIPIIALTADATADYKERCLKCGMDDYLSKPIKAKKLYETLEKYICGHN